MIFATVGTHQDGFPRMLTALESLPLADGEELVVQQGHGAPPANATRAEAFLPFPSMAELFASARVVVTHAGVGSILLATRAGHTPIVVPRLARNGEHVDDHQVELARALERDGRVVVCWDAAQLPQLVASVPPRRTVAAPEERPLAAAVGAALREGEDTSRRPRGRQGRLTRLLHDTAGAYFGVGTDFQPQLPGEQADPRALAGYWCDFRHKASPAEREPGSWLNEVLAGRPWKSPMMVSQSALGFWERHMDGEPGAAEAFVALADWLVRYADRSGPALSWLHDYPAAKYGLEPGWRSGMTQGEAISVLLRARELSGSEIYGEVAREAFELFGVDVADGGVVREIDGAMVIEEYPSARPTAVLNGWIFGLIGLHEIALVDDSPEVAAMRARAFAGFSRLLPRFDAGWWSRYSLGDHGRRPDLAKPFYHRLHVVLLDAIDAIEPDPVVHAMARKWETQATPVAMARIAVDKIVFRATRTR